MTSRMV